MKVVFFNVGQGDSIILEWESNDELLIGVIDCKRREDGKNPVLEYIKGKKILKILFLVLSHPHYDHFSGFLELLEYCEKNNIKTEYFLHTSQQTPDYLKTACLTAIATKSIQDLFIYLRKSVNESRIKVAIIQGDAPFKFPLDEKWELIPVSPSLKEFDDYIKDALPYNLEEDANNNPNANYLSTIIKLYNNANNKFLLLTSDAESRSFKRLKSRGDLFPKKHILIVAQAPHHGSKKNHHSNFWKIITPKSNNASLIISVGKNSYGHPSMDVVNFFKKNDYSISSTINLEKYKSRTSPESLLLDVFSDEINEVSMGKDVVIELD